MSGWTALGLGAKAGIIGIAVVGVAAVAVAVWRASNPVSGPTPAAPLLAQAPAAPAPQAQAPAAIPPQASSAVEPAAPAQTPTPPPPPPTPEPALPEIDTFSLAVDGGAVLAGRGMPGAGLSVLLDGQEITRGTVDARGRFAALFDIAPSDTARVMELVQTLSDGTTVPGAQTLVVAPFAAPTAPATPATPGAAPPSAQTEEVASLASPDPAADASPAPQPFSGPAQMPVAAAAPRLAAPSNLLLGGETVQVLRPAAPVTAPDAAALARTTRVVSIDTITYTQTGEVIVGGTSGAMAEIRIYLDSQLVVATSSDASGLWRATLSPVDPGLYTLRADAVDSAGRVTARSETPFLREAPAQLAALGAPLAAPPPVPSPAAPVTPGAPAAQIITVQPGFTLWGIARAAYGDGIAYVKVFEANRDQIRNPDLIYPGQVFSMPDR